MTDKIKKIVSDSSYTRMMRTLAPDVVETHEKINSEWDFGLLNI